MSSLEELSDLLTSIGRQTHSQRLYADMAARAGVNVRPYLLTTLARLRELQPVRVSDVADDMDSDRSTVSRHLTELTALGCVERRPDPHDGRAVVLSLTDLGEEVIARTFDAWLGALAEMTDDWSERDVARLVSLLRRLDAALSARPPARPTVLSAPWAPTAAEAASRANERSAPAARRRRAT